MSAALGTAKPGAEDPLREGLRRLSRCRHLPTHDRPTGSLCFLLFVYIAFSSPYSLTEFQVDNPSSPTRDDLRVRAKAINENKNHTDLEVPLLFFFLSFLVQFSSSFHFLLTALAAEHTRTIASVGRQRLVARTRHTRQTSR